MKSITNALARNKWAIELNSGLNLYPRAHQLLTGQRATFFDTTETEPQPIAYVYGAAGMQPFKAIWGAWFTSQPYEDGFICPLGWEGELAQRGIEFTEIEITPEETNESIHL